MRHPGRQQPICASPDGRALYADEDGDGAVDEVHDSEDRDGRRVVTFVGPGNRQARHSVWSIVTTARGRLKAQTGDRNPVTIWWCRMSRCPGGDSNSPSRRTGGAIWAGARHHHDVKGPNGVPATRVGRPTAERSVMLGQGGTSSCGKENRMDTDTVGRFLAALDPEQRKAVGARSRQEQERLAAAWEQELEADDELDTLDELSPPAAEAEAARRVLQSGTD